MNKERRKTRLPGGNSIAEGVFINEPAEKHCNYRTCELLGHTIRVWGCHCARGLDRAMVTALKGVLRRLNPEYPIGLMADHHPADFGVVGSVVADAGSVIPDLVGGDSGCGLSAVCIGLESELLRQELLSPRVVHLETKKGGRAFVLCLGLREGAEVCYTREDTAAALERAAGYLRAEVGSMLNLKRSPLLTFRLL